LCVLHDEPILPLSSSSCHDCDAALLDRNAGFA
jgi:hypothetical protein